jgi:hypothetical protein
VGSTLTFASRRLQPRARRPGSRWPQWANSAKPARRLQSVCRLRERRLHGRRLRRGCETGRKGFGSAAGIRRAARAIETASRNARRWDPTSAAARISRLAACDNAD